MPVDETESDISNLVRSIIETSTGRPVEIQFEDNLIEDGYLDSLTIVNLIIQLEAAYTVQIDIMDVTEENFGSITAIVQLVMQLAVN